MGERLTDEQLAELEHDAIDGRVGGYWGAICALVAEIRASRAPSPAPPVDAVCRECGHSRERHAHRGCTGPEGMGCDCPGWCESAPSPAPPSITTFHALPDTPAMRELVTAASKMIPGPSPAAGTMSDFQRGEAFMRERIADLITGGPVTAEVVRALPLLGDSGALDVTSLLTVALSNVTPLLDAEKRAARDPTPLPPLDAAAPATGGATGDETSARIAFVRLMQRAKATTGEEKPGRALVAYVERLERAPVSRERGLREAARDAERWMTEHGCSHEYPVLRNLRAALAETPAASPGATKEDGNE